MVCPNCGKRLMSSGFVKLSTIVIENHKYYIQCSCGHKVLWEAMVNLLKNR